MLKNLQIRIEIISLVAKQILMQNKFLTLILSFVAFGNFILAQDDTGFKKSREIHLTLNNISPISVNIAYKHELKENRFLNVGFVNLSAFYRNVKPTEFDMTRREIFSVSSGFLIGYEFRHAINQKFTFYHGPNLNYNISYNMSTSKDTQNDNYKISSKQLINSISVPYSLGVLYEVKPRFLLFAQVNPALGYYLEMNKDLRPELELVRMTHGVNFSFSNWASSIGLAFRFGDKPQKL